MEAAREASDGQELESLEGDGTRSGPCDGDKGAGKGAAIGGIVGAGGGTLYGLNENKKHDERYKEAYSGCMRSKGYAG